MVMTKKQLTSEEVVFLREKVPQLGFRKAALAFQDEYRYLSLNTLRARCKDQDPPILSPNKERGGGVREFKLTDEDEILLINTMTDSGFAEAMRVFGVCEETIRRKCKKLEVKYQQYIRSPTATKMRANKQDLNTEYFETWTPEMAYDLGYGFADGSVQQRGGVPRQYMLKSCTADEILVIGQRDRIGSHHFISRFIEKQENGTESPMTRIGISSRRLTESLIETHKMLPAKSKLDVPFPHVPEEFFCHFARGYLDGDGCIGMYNYEYRASPKYNCFFLGTKHFTETLYERLRQAADLSPGNAPSQNNATGKAWRIQWQGIEDIRKLHRFLYPERSYFYPYLARKRQKFVEITTEGLAPPTEYLAPSPMNLDKAEQLRKV